MSITIDTAVPTGTWTLDPTHSTVGFAVVYMGVAPFQGAFRSFDADLDENGLRGVAQAGSIDVDNDQLPSTSPRPTSSTPRRTRSSRSRPARRDARATA